MNPLWLSGFNCFTLKSEILSTYSKTVTQVVNVLWKFQMENMYIIATIARKIVRKRIISIQRMQNWCQKQQMIRVPFTCKIANYLWKCCDDLSKFIHRFSIYEIFLHNYISSIIVGSTTSFDPKKVEKVWFEIFYFISFDMNSTT